jgi:cytidylate kinase
MTTSLIIAIDGPAGAGKSTVAARLAARFGLLNLETGAMYRALALKALEQHVALNDGGALAALCGSTTIELEPTAAGNRVLLDGTDVTARIRESAVTQAASEVSVHPPVRSWMVAMQRKMGEKGGVVMEGRDIGTAVFPDATLKIFLDASPEIRGQRRFDQNGPSSAAQEAVLRELRERDQRDRTRAQSPLKPADDAVVVDSTHLTLDEVVARIESLVTERLVSR